jgi:hypothetical protein
VNVSVTSSGDFSALEISFGDVTGDKQFDVLSRRFH